MTVSRTKQFLAVTALSLVLSACTAYEYVSDKISDPLILRCPDYWVVADAASVVKFRDGAGRDLTDVNYEGEIVDVKLACTSNVDKRTRTGIMEVDVTVLLNAQRGPANRDRKARFDYFIRILDRNKKFLKGQNLSTGITFPGNKTRLQFTTQPLTLELPISPKWGPTYYRIFAGFKLTREELDFNRKKSGQTN